MSKKEKKIFDRDFFVEAGRRGGQIGGKQGAAVTAQIKRDKKNKSKKK
jgi:hypothetical protein